MRSVGVVLLAAGLVLAGPVRGRADDGPGNEAAMAIGAGLANLAYVPAKLIVAAGGLVVGAFAGLATGGDTRAAYAFWVPAAGGTYLLTPAHLDGSRPTEFFGSDYADRPSSIAREGEAGMVYDAMYKSR
jgi:hypothetical protein